MTFDDIVYWIIGIIVIIIGIAILKWAILFLF